MTDIVERIMRLFIDRGAAEYQGEAVTQLEHALQAAALAESAGQSPELITAALLHDIGHLLHGLGEDYLVRGVNDQHEDLGARFLAQHFPAGVVEPVRLHVPAKRYLCATDESYRHSLSPVSQRSLELQGGPMSPDEVREFDALPFASDAVALRRWDDLAKDPGFEPAPLNYFRPYVEAALAR